MVVVLLVGVETPWVPVALNNINDMDLCKSDKGSVDRVKGDMGEVFFYLFENQVCTGVLF